MHTLDEEGNVTHYDVMFESKIIKNIPVSDLVVIEGMYHEHFVNDKKNQEVLDEKESYDTVAAVIDYDRSKKGTDDATYDSMHGKKKQAKKERDYAAFERGKMKKDDPNWKHKKGSTSEEVEALAASGKFTVEEIAKISGIEIDEAQTAYEKARKAAARRAADRNAARRRGEMGGRMERETYTNEAGKEMHYKGYSA